MNNSQAIGIDFGGTSVKVAVVSGSELLTEIRRIPTQDFDGPDPLLAAITETVEDLRQGFPEVVAVGVGVPGTVDFERGFLHNLTNVRGWTNVPVRGKLAELTGMPTVVDNDANCMAYAEWKYGAGQGYQNVVCLTLGTGVGGGLILNGDMFRGSTFAAGEIGQMSINFKGVEGPYGNSGALERYIGNRQIEAMAVQLYGDQDLPLPEDHGPEALSKLAEEGDEVAIKLWSQVAHYLAVNLTNVVYLLNPEAIVIGGGVACAGDLLFEPLLERMKEMLPHEFFDQLQVLRAKFGNDAGMIGCSAMAANLAES